MAKWRGELLPSGEEGYRLLADGEAPDGAAQQHPVELARLPTSGPKDRGTQRAQPARTILYDVRERAGLSDRLWVIQTLLAVANASNARLAFPAPQQALGKHGNSTAAWWDVYFAIEPPLLRLDEAACDPAVEPLVVSSAEDVQALVSNGVLTDFDQPLCLQLRVGFWAGHMHKYLESTKQQGLPNIRIWTSGFVSALVLETINTDSRLQREYNAVHVRLGDKATPRCASAQYVIDNMLEAESSHPEFQAEPWLLMSDGDDAFYADIRKQAHKNGINLVTERDLKVIQSEKDDFLRYLATICLYGGSAVALRSAGSCLGATCVPRATHAFTDWMKCKDEM